MVFCHAKREMKPGAPSNRGGRASPLSKQVGGSKHDITIAVQRGTVVSLGQQNC